jgi:hypothetical protein
MTLNISLTSEAEAKLKERAAAAGQDVEHYAELLVLRGLAEPPSLLDAAEPIARAVEEAGVTDEEFLKIITDARDAARRERRRKQA